MAYEGKRIKPQGGDDLYLVLATDQKGAVARYIPDMDVVRRLWNDANAFENVPHIALPGTSIPVPGGSIPIGTELGGGTCLLKRSGSGAIYFFDGVNAWHVPSMEVFNAYQFRENFVDPDAGGIDWGGILRLGIGVLSAVAG